MSMSVRTNSSMLELTAASCVYISNELNRLVQTTRAVRNLQEPEDQEPSAELLGVQICTCALTGFIFLVLKSL